MRRAATTVGFRMGADAWTALLAFLALAVASTWPLSVALTTSLPADYGDPLFVTWVMAWVARHLTRALTGDLGALVSMWDAPIFAPETNTLAFSEHFVGPAVQALPIYWLTGNPLLAYNILFLSTFVLSGLGAYLFVRELTTSRLGGLVAGVLFSVNDFRTTSISHLHTLSAHWVPLAMLGLLVFARSGSRLALAFAAASVIALNMSSGYYMLYFGPMTAVFALVVLRRHTPWRTRQGWTWLAAAGAAVALVQLPLVLPYLELQRATTFSRTRAEVEVFSFTLTSIALAFPIWRPCCCWRRRACWPGEPKVPACGGRSCSLRPLACSARGCHSARCHACTGCRRPCPGSMTCSSPTYRATRVCAWRSDSRWC